MPVWLQHIKSFATCTIAGCTATAVGCFVANTIDAEVLWAPCWLIGCAASGTGCAVIEFYKIVSHQSEQQRAGAANDRERAFRKPSGADKPAGLLFIPK